MASYTLSPIGGAGSQFFDNSGNVLTGGKLYTYAAGTTTPQTTWTTPAGITANSNPIVLNSAGRPAQEIWLSSAYSYKFVLKDSNDVLIATYDNIPGLPQPAIANDASSISYEPNVLVTAGSFVIGQTYMIASLGTTDFTVIGAGYNSTGVIFTASGAGTGTGTAYVSTTVETRLRAYEADGGSDYIGFSQAGTGAITTQTVQDKLRQTVSVKDFGAVGDGVTDDTAAIQAAIDAVYANGGGVIDCTGGRWLIDSADLQVKQGVQLVGPYSNLGETDNIDYSTVESVFIVNDSYTIRLVGEFAGVKGIGVFRKGLVKPNSLAQAAVVVAAFAGVGITIGDGTSKKASDCYVGYCLILGFDKAIYSDFNERPRIEYVSGDCTNGIYLKQCYDMNHLSHCHFWPFVTAHQSWSSSGAAGYRRNGVGYRFETGTDWGQADNCFAYGYDRGFHISDSDHTELLNCGADNYAPGGDTTTIGFLINGNTQSAKLIGCKSAAQGQGFGFDTTNTGAAALVSMIGCDCWGNLTSDVSVVRGRLLATGNIFSSNATVCNVSVQANAELVTLTNNQFSNATVPISLASQAQYKIQTFANQFTNSDAVVGNRILVDNQLKEQITSVFSNDAGGYLNYVRKAQGSANSPIATTTNSAISSNLAQAFDGTNWSNVGYTQFQLRGSVSAGATPGAWLVATTPLASNAAVSRVMVNEQGNLFPLTDNAYSCGGSGARWSEIWAANGTIQTSDKRTKIEVKDASLGLGFINTLRPVSYKWVEGSNKVIRQVYLDKDGNEIPENQPIPDDATPGQIITEPVQGKRTHWGLIAQEVKEAVDAAGVDFGGWILTDKDNPDSQQALRYDQFIAPLIKAVQELSARVAELEAK